MIIPSDFIFVNSISRNMHKRFMDFFRSVYKELHADHETRVADNK